MEILKANFSRNILLGFILLTSLGCGDSYQAKKSTTDIPVAVLDQGSIDSLHEEINGLRTDTSEQGENLEDEILKLALQIIDKADRVIDGMWDAVEFAEKYLPKSLRIKLAKEIEDAKEKVLELIEKAQGSLNIDKAEHLEAFNRLEDLKAQVVIEFTEMMTVLEKI